MKSKRFVSLSILTALSIGLFSGTLAVKSHQDKNFVFVDEADYYSGVTDSMMGTTLLNKLNDIIDTNSVSVSYDWSRYEAADQDPNNTSNVILIYARNSVPKTAHVSGSTGWNREHTFPASKLSNTKAEKDNHIIYASNNKVNGARSNIKMGVVNGGSVVNDYFGNPTTCRKTDDLFDPHNVARGIVARTTMYAAAMYGYDPEDNFESIETMLSWHLEYLPTTLDQGRNDTVYSNQHNRNPFVDHPEYACRIWGNTSTETKQICGYIGSVSLNKTTASLEIGQTTTIKATSSDSSAITWSTSNSNVVAIGATQSGSGTEITLTAGEAGNANVTATATINGQTYTATCAVTVSDPYVPAVLDHIQVMGGYESTFNVGDEFIFGGTVNAYYTNGEYENVTYACTFSGYNMNVAGTQVVTASYTEGGITKTDTYNITVNPLVVPVRSVSLNSDYEALNVGDTFQLEATINPTNATNKNVTWSFLNYDGYDNVISVDENGLVTALGSGFATVKVTTEDGGKTAECIIEVLAEPTPPKPTPAKSGCGGNVIAASIILSSLALTGFVVLLIVKVKKRQK